MTINHSNTTLASLMKSLLTMMMLMMTASTAMAMSQDVTMHVGETKTLNLPSSFTSMYPYCKSTTWMSYGNEYVTVTSSSMLSVTVKAKKALSTPVVVRCDYYYYLLSGGKYVYGGHTFYDFLVTVEGSQPTAISLDPSEATLDRGKSVNLKPVLTPSNATTTYSWSTSSPGVATVDQNGHVIGQNYGEATITCKTANGLKATCCVTVRRPAPTSVSIDDLLTLTIGQSQTLTPALTPSNATTTYTWYSDNTQVASVNSSGEVTARKKGLARITVTTANGLSDYCDVTVYAPSPSSVSIKKSISLEVGQSEKLTPTLAPSNAETSYTWSSTDSDIASVSSDGTVKGKAPGTTNVTVRTANGKTACCQVTVNEQVILPASITMTDCLDLTVGDEYQLYPTISPANATNKTINWSSSDVAVATVRNGLVKAIGTGTCNINATTNNGLTAKCYVVVVSRGNTDDTDTDITDGWEGSYQFTADVTRFVASEMPFNEVFDITITQKEDGCYITSMMGCNTVFIIYEGLKLNIIDASRAEIVLKYNNCLGDPVNGGHYSNLHQLNPDDKYNHINNQVITITRHAGGTTEMSDFNIYAFGHETDYEFLREVKYCNVSGKRMEVTDITELMHESDAIEVYDLNGRCIYRGQKGECPRLDKGMYIFKSGEVTQKVFIR